MLQEWFFTVISGIASWRENVEISLIRSKWNYKLGMSNGADAIVTARQWSGEGNVFSHSVCRSVWPQGVPCDHHLDLFKHVHFGLFWPPGHSLFCPHHTGNPTSVLKSKWPLKTNYLELFLITGNYLRHLKNLRGGRIPLLLIWVLHLSIRLSSVYLGGGGHSHCGCGVQVYSPTICFRPQ